MGVRRVVPPAWAAAWILALAFAVLGLGLAEPAHRLRYERIENHQGMPLRVVVFEPEAAGAARAPAAVVCQSLNNPPEYARLLALELVREGFVVLTFDWHGREAGENRQLLRSGALEVLRSDVTAAVAHLRRLPEVDPERIVLAGHSVGGTLAIEAGLGDPRIAAVAAIGIEADVTPTWPRNLLWALGLYDEFRLLGRMRRVFEVSAGTTARENTTVGDFRQGTARRLGVSPTSDHFTELQDRGIHREVVAWFRQAVGLETRARRQWMEVRHLLLLLAWLAAVLGALLTLRRLAAGRRWALRAAAAVALLVAVLLSRFAGDHFLLVADVAAGLVVFTLLAGFVGTRPPEAFERGRQLAIRVGLILWVSLLLTLVVNNAAHYLHEPRYLLSLPEFALRHPLDGLYAYGLVYARPLLFSVYGPEAMSLRLWVYAAMAIEVFFPGLLLGLVAGGAWRRASGVPGRRPLPVASVVVLLVLLGLLVGMVWLRLEQGFLTGESARAALRFLARFTLPPIVIFALVWRRLGRRGAPSG